MKNNNSFLKIYNDTKPHGLQRLLLDVSSVIIAFYNFIIANIIQILFQEKKEISNYNLILFVICVIAVFSDAVAYYIIKKVSTQNSLKIEKKIKDRLLSKLNNINYLKVQCLNDGKWMTIADSDVNIVSKFYQVCILNTIIGWLGFCLAIIFGLQSSWKLTIIIMIFSTVSFFFQS